MFARILAILLAAGEAPTLAQSGAPAQPSLAGMTSADQAKRSAEDLARMRSALKEVTARAEAARAAKDIVKLNCVNERLTQMRSFLKTAEEADRAWATTAARRDPSAAAELAKVGSARSRVEALRAESEACVSLVAFAPEQRTQVEVQVPPDLPEPGVEWGDGVRPVPPPPPVVRPSPASLFQ